MNARLFCKTGQLAGVAREFRDEATIGKETGNTVQLDAAPVSGRHARIFFDPKAGIFMLEDLGSRNGTRLDGVRVREKEKLGNLHVITFAEKFDFIFQVINEQRAVPTGATSDGESGKQAKGTERPPVPESTKKPEGAKTVFDDAPMVAPPSPGQAGQKTVIDDAPVAAPRMTPAGEPVPPNVSPQLKEAPPAKEAPSGKKTVFDDDFLASPQIRSAGEKSIGEEKPGQPGAAAGEVAAPPGSGPALPASGGEPSKPVAFELEVSTGPRAAFDLREGENILGRGETSAIRIEDNSLSRQHAVITVASGRVTVKDLGSKNSTFVGNNRIREEVEITTGSDLRFGLVQARLRKKP